MTNTCTNRKIWRSSSRKPRKRARPRTSQLIENGRKRPRRKTSCANREQMSFSR